MEKKLNNNKKLIYTIEDSRNLSINHTDFYTTQSYDCAGNIKSVTFDNNHTISTGSTISMEITSSGDHKSAYYINSIQMKEKEVILQEEPFYESNFFLVPSIIANNPSHFGLMSYFMNAYSHCNLNGWEDKEGIIYLKYRFSPFPRFISIDKFLCNQKNFIDKFDLDSHKIYAFKIIPKYRNDVIFYLSNLQPNISENYAHKIVDTFQLNKKRRLYKVLLKRDSYRKELENFFNMDIPLDWNIFNLPINPKLNGRQGN